MVKFGSNKSGSTSSTKQGGQSRRVLVLVTSLAILGLILGGRNAADYYLEYQQLLLVGEPQAATTTTTTAETLEKQAQQSSISSSSSSLSSSPYVCNSEQKVGKMKLFAHTETCGGKDGDDKSVNLQIPDEGYIFAARYFLTIYETRVRDVFTKVLRSKSSEELQAGVVLDIGGNSGWYAAYAAACFGIRVHVFEPQQGCLNIMCPLIHHNNLQHLVTIHHNIVASTPKTILLEQGCDPGFSPDLHLVGKDNHDASSSSSSTQQLITSVAAADFVQAEQPVWMIKIDTEGTEMGVLQSLEPLLQDGRAKNIVVEVKTKSWEQDGKLEDNLQEFSRLIYDNHFSVYSLEKKTYITAAEFPQWMVTKGKVGDNNFWLQKQEEHVN